jgi:hypothetical protein
MLSPFNRCSTETSHFRVFIRFYVLEWMMLNKRDFTYEKGALRG